MVCKGSMNKTPEEIMDMAKKAADQEDFYLASILASFASARGGEVEGILADIACDFNIKRLNMKNDEYQTWLNTAGK